MVTGIRQTKGELHIADRRQVALRSLRGEVLVGQEGREAAQQINCSETGNGENTLNLKHESVSSRHYTSSKLTGLNPGQNIAELTAP